ncbi:glucose-6-phosphate isomerase [Candidatus Margulisiibacteriota bacterium]
MKSTLFIGDTFSLNVSNYLKKNLSNEEGVEFVDLKKYDDLIQKAHKQLDAFRNGSKTGHGEEVKFMKLPYPDSGLHDIENLKTWGKKIQDNFESVVFIGIGGSFLGNQTLFKALKHTYWNELSKSKRKGMPKVYFAGNNVDPRSLKDLMDVIKPQKTHYVVISKSGNTMEPAAALMKVFDLLKKKKLPIDKHVTAVTDAQKGTLKQICQENNIQAFTVPDGVGGRWSILSEVGLVTAAACGIDIDQLLAGARSVDEITKTSDLQINLPLLYALIQYIFYKNFNKHVTVLMPYCDCLKSLSEWYVQLLAESTGKKFDKEGNEVFEGRTPLPALGTTDMHAQTQQHQEGANYRIFTFISIKNFKKRSLKVPEEFKHYEKLQMYAGKKMVKLLDAALSANEQALASESRPNCRITVSELNEFTLGQLLFFFEAATAYEGEFLNINTYDQPGVEAYKQVMGEILSK